MDWNDFVKRLTIELMRLPVRSFLIVQGTGGLPYVQALRSREGLEAESVGSAFLPRPLSPSQERRLRMIGWEPPEDPETQNWWRHVPLAERSGRPVPDEPERCATLAGQMVNAFRDVYGVGSPLDLVYQAGYSDGGPLAVPGLGLPRAVLEGEEETGGLMGGAAAVGYGASGEGARRLEAALAAAREHGDQNAYLELLSHAVLHLPSPTDPTYDDGARHEFATAQFGDDTFVLAFTSPEAMVRSLRGQAVHHRRCSLADLVRNWPDPAWQLAINPGLPSAAYLDATALPLGGPAPHQAGPQPQARPPASRPNPHPPQAPPPQARPDEGRSLSPEPEQAPPERPEPPPGPQPQVPLVSESGTAPRRPEGPEAGPAVPQAVPQDIPPPAPPRPQAPPRTPPAPGDRVVASGPPRRTPPAPQTRPEQPPAAPTGPAQPRTAQARPVQARPAEPASEVTVMQKVIRPEHVAHYLEGGYELVAGYVHRLQDVRDLNTPAKLVRGLGLVYEGTPFRSTDEAVYVIRWPAVKPALFRRPLGGIDEWSMGLVPGGWVIEKAPFPGSGYAPGEGTAIPEFKIDSQRLPHGAEMYRIERSGRETLLGGYDADLRRWLLRPGVTLPAAVPPPGTANPAGSGPAPGSHGPGGPGLPGANGPGGPGGTAPAADAAERPDGRRAPRSGDGGWT